MLGTSVEANKGNHDKDRRCPFWDCEGGCRLNTAVWRLGIPIDVGLGVLWDLPHSVQRLTNQCAGLWSFLLRSLKRSWGSFILLVHSHMERLKRLELEQLVLRSGLLKSASMVRMSIFTCLMYLPRHQPVRHMFTRLLLRLLLLRSLNISARGLVVATEELLEIPLEDLVTSLCSRHRHDQRPPSNHMTDSPERPVELWFTRTTNG